MRLRYSNPAGQPVVFRLGEHPITIGRSPKADLVIEDDKASRLHSGIRKEPDGYTIKDLNSKNGTFVNNEKVDSARLSPGDRIRIGSIVMVFESDSEPKGATTAFHEMEEEISKGKGYDTLLKEIVSQVDPGTKPERPEKP